MTTKVPSSNQYRKLKDPSGFDGRNPSLGMNIYNDFEYDFIDYKFKKKIKILKISFYDFMILKYSLLKNNIIIDINNWLINSNSIFIY